MILTLLLYAIGIGSILIFTTISQIVHNPNRPWIREGLSSNKQLTIKIMDLLDREAWSLLMKDSRIHIKPVYYDLIVLTH